MVHNSEVGWCLFAWFGWFKDCFGRTTVRKYRDVTWGQNNSIFICVLKTAPTFTLTTPCLNSQNFVKGKHYFPHTWFKIIPVCKIKIVLLPSCLVVYKTIKTFETPLQKNANHPAHRWNGRRVFQTEHSSMRSWSRVLLFLILV